MSLPRMSGTIEIPGRLGSLELLFPEIRLE